MYVFTVFSYFYLFKVYSKGFCDSLFRCLLTSFDKSFKNDGGIGGFLNPYEDLEVDENNKIDGRNKTEYLFVYFFYRNLFYITLLIVMLNIVSGIIIDEFKSLRFKLKEYEKDLKNFCYICGFDSEIIEKNTDSNRGFKYHIKKEHYM